MLDQIRHALKDRNLTVVAKAVGLNKHTLYRLMTGTVNPSPHTVQIVHAYLFGK